MKERFGISDKNMSFSTDVSAELSALQIKKPCCRRALVLGMLMGARKVEEGGHISYFYEKSSAELVFENLKVPNLFPSFNSLLQSIFCFNNLLISHDLS